MRWTRDHPYTPFLICAVYLAAIFFGKKPEANYWGEGATTLEWSLSSPPPFHQFETLPVIEDHHSADDHISAKPANA